MKSEKDVTPENEIWKKISKHSSSIANDLRDGLARELFWSALDQLMAFRSSRQNQLLEPRLAVSCKRDPHPGFRCILAAGHPPPCIFEPWSIDT